MRSSATAHAPKLTGIAYSSKSRASRHTPTRLPYSKCVSVPRSRQSGSTVVEYSNDERTAVILTPDDVTFNPATYSEFVWTKPAGGAFYYCIAAYDCASPEQAKNGPSDGYCTLSDIDDSDPENAGCGTFPWTKLSEQ